MNQQVSIRLLCQSASHSYSTVSLDLPLGSLSLEFSKPFSLMILIGRAGSQLPACSRII